MPTQPTLVFLHGFAESQEIWSDFIRDFPTGYHLLTPDLLGHGANTETLNLSMEAQAEHVAALLARAEVEQALLIGHSMGGYVALALAEKYSAKVAGLCLLNSSALADSEEKKQSREKNITFIERHGVDKFMASFIRPLFAPAHRDKMPAQQSLLEKIGKATPAGTFTAGLRAMAARPDRTSVLRGATFPVLLIAGKEDVAVPLEQSIAQADLAPESYAVFFDDVGHLSYLEQPERTRQVLVDFAGKVFAAKEPE